MPNKKARDRDKIENTRELTTFVRTNVDSFQQQALRLQALESVSPGRTRLLVLSSTKEIKQSDIEEEYAAVILPRSLLGTSNIFPIYSELLLYNVSAATNNLIFRVRYGSEVTAFGPISLAPLSTQTDYRVCRIWTKIIGDGSVSNQRVNTLLTLSAVGELASGVNVVEAEFKSAFTVASNLDQSVQLTVQHSDSTVLFRTVRNVVEFGFPVFAA